jgi:kynureninase
LRYVDIWDAVSAMAEVLSTGCWQDGVSQTRKRVT